MGKIVIHNEFFIIYQKLATLLVPRWGLKSRKQFPIVRWGIAVGRMDNQVRIIGGKWRGRKILFPNLPTLRPTPNRVRETLFNWLMPYIQGATCLDMFAGSGSLSFEALSRGAEYVVMWEQIQEAIKMLKENAKRFQAEHLEIHSAHFPDHLPKLGSQYFDLVFLDPPFHQGYVKQVSQWLAHSNCLKEGALIYLEVESSLNPLPIPENWEILKSKKAGEVSFYLAQVHSYSQEA